MHTKYTLFKPANCYTSITACTKKTIYVKGPVDDLTLCLLAENAVLQHANSSRYSCRKKKRSYDPDFKCIYQAQCQISAMHAHGRNKASSAGEAGLDNYKRDYDLGRDSVVDPLEWDEALNDVHVNGDIVPLQLGPFLCI